MDTKVALGNYDYSIPVHLIFRDIQGHWNFAWIYCFNQLQEGQIYEFMIYGGFGCHGSSWQVRKLVRLFSVFLVLSLSVLRDLEILKNQPQKTRLPQQSIVVCILCQYYTLERQLSRSFLEVDGKQISFQTLLNDTKLPVKVLCRNPDQITFLSSTK